MLRWVDAWVGEFLDGRMNARMDGLKLGCSGERSLHGRTDRCSDAWAGELDGHGWMDMDG